MIVRAGWNRLMQNGTASLMDLDSFISQIQSGQIKVVTWASERTRN